MIDNAIYTIGFRVRKYGSAEAVQSKFENVVEDGVAEDNLFEF